MAKGNKSIADAIVVSMGKGDPDFVDRGEEDSEEMETTELEAVASEILEAITAEDLTTLADALKSFVKLCKYEEEGD